MTKKYFQGSIETLTYTVLAAAAVAAGQLVSFDNKPASAGDKVQGVAAHDVDEIGEALRIVALGVVDMEAGAAVSKGSGLASDANGLPVSASEGAAVFGIALGDAGAGERVSVLIR